MELIKQRGLYDCGVACMAMALNMTYDQALVELGRDPNDVSAEFEGQSHVGVLAEEMSWVAFRRGIEHYIIACHPIGTWMQAWKDVVSLPSIEWIAIALFVDYSHRAMLVVPSKNTPDAAHWIYLEDGVVYDPSNRLVYEPGEVLPLQTVVLLRKEHE